MIAVRVRRFEGGVPSNTEKDLLKRARREGIYAGGELTDRGREFVAAADGIKERIREELHGSAMRRDSLAARLRIPVLIDAALDDLEADGEIVYTLTTCDSCGDSHIAVAMKP